MAGRVLRGCIVAVGLAAGPILPAAAGGAVGPCSPFHAADGDVPSEMPGCARRLRPAPGSLDDELGFRRGRGAADGDADPDDEPAPRHRRRR